jgi:replicative superfamily II helicase
MHKLTAAHVLKINMLVLKTTEDYINFSTTQWGVNSPITADNLKYSTLDVQHNINALVAFNMDNNVQKLHDSIMLQDTFVREYYIDTLRYIESNKLISADNFCCI